MHIQNKYNISFHNDKNKSMENNSVVKFRKKRHLFMKNKATDYIFSG